MRLEKTALVARLHGIGYFATTLTVSPHKKAMVINPPCCRISSSRCSITEKNSVRSSGTQCSTSRFWYLSDFVIAGGFAYLVAINYGEAAAYIPTGVFAGSGLIGIWKRGNCVRYRRTAPPEAWARDSERAAREDAARAAAMRDMSARMHEPQPTYAPAPAPDYSQPTSSPPTYSSTSSQSTTSSNVSVSVERITPLDDLGKTCSSPNDTDRELPTAGTCRAGALCYQGRCTVSCGNDGSCPAGMQCAWTDGRTKTKICR